MRNHYRQKTMVLRFVRCSFGLWAPWCEHILGWLEHTPLEKYCIRLNIWGGFITPPLPPFDDVLPMTEF